MSPQRERVRAAVLAALAEVAPEADLDALRPDIDIREQLDVDSMDMLNVVIALHRSLGVAVPEADYGRLATLDGCVDYLTARAAGAAPGA